MECLVRGFDTLHLHHIIIYFMRMSSMLVWLIVLHTICREFDSHHSHHFLLLYSWASQSDGHGSIWPCIFTTDEAKAETQKCVSWSFPSKGITGNLGHSFLLLYFYCSVAQRQSVWLLTKGSRFRNSPEHPFYIRSRHYVMHNVKD